MCMTIKKGIKLTGIIGGGTLLIVGIIMGIAGVWPIAAVGYTPITYDVFKKNFLMADHFYRSTVKITGEDDVIVDAKEIQRDLQRATMEGLIEQILIDRELKRKYDNNDLKRLIENKIKGIDLGTEDIAKATNLLYGISPEEFRELVLLPKAKQELLEGNITLQNGTFSDWLMVKKSESNVLVFVPTLYWDGGQMKVK
ncbi:TPA: hypothetical protein DDZ49_02450 [Candidatus Wolfebacteria bacterium]|uniref:PpiC-type peptidyl-prolyl cis-trans isomerase n=2 Tax=Candidatus Wolfeibacteriota TaxID=1752735 RepID=A0A0G4ATZ8_9BACT|nr:MAG: hypothetical protein UX70_C0001G0981 [Candidatus Wolfebacteria bacterium GW2011_GWB1_47_1]KKU75374.1 MAG: hypothetical protein UY00_C0044G0006 [Candidatus Wolfebacteria bacterium GW2011_GWA1_47_6]HAL24250.1 hypothetical protein [Candidatus Wolfebacteria bacterium]HAS95540.1 hypothetical protein [Candidatus Wolfebacteria bacterium]HBD18618.1 hypothetical protein [Candidatus Wolfebacteria bacterium]